VVQILTAIPHACVIFQVCVVSKPGNSMYAKRRNGQLLSFKVLYAECAWFFYLFWVTSTLRMMDRFVRRFFRSDVKHVIYLQSCLRRRLARKQLKTLKAEARSVSKFKEISYRLENKVVELTQNLQKRTEEKKELQAQLTELEQQLQQWINRHEESDNRAKQSQASLSAAEAEISRRDELLQAKANVEKRLEEAIALASEKERIISKLTDDLIRQATQLELQQRAMDAGPPRNHEDSSVIMTLKNEVSSLREQLNRSNALSALTRGSRFEPPSSPTFAPALRLETNGVANGSVNGHGGTSGNRHQRRHSSAGVFATTPPDYRTSTDELLMDVKKSQAMNPRAVSVAYNGEDTLRYRQVNGLSGIRDFDDPAEEKIRLMQDSSRLDEDVLDGLIRGLKIPAPSLNNPSAVKEILFPANLISLVTNEMWKYGLIQESERFLANVMQTIQAHVMVCPVHYVPYEHELIVPVVVQRRRSYRSWHFLVIERARDVVLHMCGRK